MMSRVQVREIAARKNIGKLRAKDSKLSDPSLNPAQAGASYMHLAALLFFYVCGMDSEVQSSSSRGGRNGRVPPLFFLSSQLIIYSSRHFDSSNAGSSSSLGKGR